MLRRLLHLALTFPFFFFTAQQAIGGSKPDTNTAHAMNILKSNCLSCHGEEKHKGGLRLTTQANALKGGENGPVITPRKPETSSLLKAVMVDSDPHMPPKKQLSQSEILTLTQWVSNGAKWDEKLLQSIGSEPPIRFVEMPSEYKPVFCIALSPDGKILAIGRGERLYLHDLSQTNHPVLHELRGHHDAIQSLAWSADGKSLASGGFRKIVVWNCNAFPEKQEFTNGLIGRITSLRFTTNAQTLLATDGIPTKSGLVHFISPSGGKQVTIEAHKDSIYDLTLSPDGKSFATAGADKLAKLWDLDNHREIAKYEAHMGYVLSLAFNDDGSSLATGGADKVLNIWDVKTGKQDITINKHPGPISSLFWSDHGKQLFSACQDGSVRRFTNFKSHSGTESSDGAQERLLNKVDDMLYCITANADGSRVYAGCHNGTVYCWNNDGKLLDKFEPTPVQTSEIAKLN